MYYQLFSHTFGMIPSDEQISAFKKTCAFFKFVQQTLNKHLTAHLHNTVIAYPNLCVKKGSKVTDLQNDVLNLMDDNVVTDKSLKMIPRFCKLPYCRNAEWIQKTVIPEIEKEFRIKLVIYPKKGTLFIPFLVTLLIVMQLPRGNDCFLSMDTSFMRGIQ